MKRFSERLRRPFVRWRRLRGRRRARKILIVSGILWLFALAILAWLGGRVAWVSLQRIRYPYELEFQEGDHALAAMRVLDGKPLYPPPDGDYLPLLYTPLTHHFSAWIMKALGERSLFAGRLMASIATFGCLAILFGWVRRETRRTLPALAAPMLFYAIAPLTGWWFDLYRVDMPSLLLVAIGAWALMDRREGERAEIAKGIFAGAMLVLAALAKQSAAAMAIGLVMLALPISPLRAVWAASAGSAFGLIALVRLTLAGHDFWFYCVSSIARMGYNLQSWRERTWLEFFGPAIPLELLGGGLLLFSAIKPRLRRALYFPLAFLALAVALRGLLKLGGYVNHYLIAWYFLSLLAGIALGDLKRLSPRPIRRATSWLAPLAALAAAVWIADATRAAAWHRDPTSPAFLSIRADDRLENHIPQAARDGDRMIAAIRNLDGPAWIMHHNYYGYLAQGESALSVDSVRDLTIGGHPVSPFALAEIASGKFDFILLDNSDIAADWLDDPVRQAIRRYYFKAEDWEARFGFMALRPVDATAMKPRALWVRRDRAGK